jgi:uncharacterized protein (TIGR03435 family)
MIRPLVFAALVAVAAVGVFAQSRRPAFDAFDVATIKPTSPDWNGGRYIRMEGAQFVLRNHELRRLIAAAWNLTPRAVSGGPAWIDSDHYDIFAKPPGDVRPGYDEQMTMLRTLVTERFHMTFHREPKDFSIYSLTIAKNGPKLKDSSAAPDAQAEVINTVLPEKEGGVYLHLPARNATMAQFTAMLQRGVFDRPVVDNTGLSGRYDFELEWSPDDAQFNGAFARPAGSGAPTKADFFSAIQDQLGLRLEATRGPVSTLVIDKIERPSDN